MDSIFFQYFPTKVMFVDDEEDVLSSMRVSVDYSIGSYDFLVDTNRALSLINKPGYDFREQSLPDWLLDGTRFEEISTVVVDFQMPSMSGLEFCSKINNPYIRKILYTGIADETVAIQAFNNGLIDGYIQKHDPNKTRMLKDFIDDGKSRYFRRLTSLLSNRQSDTILDDTDFQHYFRNLIQAKGICEYYFNNQIPGFTCLTSCGTLSILYVFTRETLWDNQIYALDLSKSEASTLSDIQSGLRAICPPIYGKEAFDLNDKTIPNYIKILEKIGNSCSVAFVTYPNLRNEVGIISFDDFQAQQENLK